MVKILATAEFSADMATTLKTYFESYADRGIVSVEVTDCGLWLVNPHAQSRQFLGLASSPKAAIKKFQKGLKPIGYLS